MRSLNFWENIILAEEYLFKYKKIRKFPYLSSEEINHYQFEKVKKIVELAYYHTKFYRQKYNALDIHPEDIKTWKNFKNLPTVTKEEVIQSHKDSIVGNTKSDSNLILSRSSGSSGKMLDIYLNGKFFIDKALVAHRHYETICEYKPYQKQLLIYTSEYPYRSLLGKFYKVYYINNLVPLKQLFHYILEVKPTLITGYPSILIDLINEYGDELKKIDWIQAICTNSEHSSQEQRNFIGSIFHCDVYDEYSSEELSKFAYQCQYKNYHIQEDVVYAEILKESSDESVNEGDIGEIIGTSLHNNIMPFIRYRQGDLGAIDLTKCKCKRNMQILKNISGRKNNSFKLSNGRIIPTGKLLDWTYKLFLEFKLPIIQFQLVQKELNLIEIIIVPENGYNFEVDDNLITSSFKNEFGKFLTIKITRAAVIPKTPVGKHIPIKSLVR